MRATCCYTRERPASPKPPRPRAYNNKITPSEQALVRTLKALRELLEEEHALARERAANIPPLDFEAVIPTGRSCVFRMRHEPGAATAAARGLQVGDGVDILQPDGREAGRFGVISALEPSRVRVDFSRPLRPDDLPSAGMLRMRVDANQCTIRLQAIERVVRERATLGWVGAVLAEADPLPLAEPAWEPPSELGLTDGQRRALVGASRSRDLFLIQGPPGTGKTTVIAALVRHFTRERGARVLLSSKGHRAIDHALERLGASDLHVLRLGQAGKVTGAGQEVRFADVVAQAEQEVPQRHRSARAELEEWSRSLAGLEHLLAELDALNARIHAYDRVCAQHLSRQAARPRVRTARPHPGCRVARPLPHQGTPRHPMLRVQVLERVVQPAHRLLDRLHHVVRLARPEGASPSAPPEAARAALGPPSEAARAPTEAAGLRAQHRQVVARVHATLSDAARGVCGLQLPALSVATADQTRAALGAVRRVRDQTSATLRALAAWGALLEQPGRLADVLVETADVVAATAVGINSGRDAARLAELDFDVAIIDEAGQAQLTDLIVPLSRAGVVILVGDHQQLPPYLDNDLLRRCADKGIETGWLETSVFEHLWQRVPESHRARLDTQFRMPEAIASFLGQVFYQGELASAAACQGGAPVCGLFQSPVVLVDTSGAPERGERAVAPGFVNAYEAGLIAKIAAALPSDARTVTEGLGIIAPYSAQVSALRQAVASTLGLAANDAWLVDIIATVDSFQGQERDVLLVSLTRSNAEGAVGFLSDLKRLNVTLSRARQQLVIVGDLATLCAPGGGPERQAFARFMGNLAEHVRQHGELLEVHQLRRRLDLA